MANKQAVSPKGDKLSLIDRIPLKLSGWARVRPLGKFLGSYEEAWCEVRGPWFTASVYQDQQQSNGKTIFANCKGAHIVVSKRKNCVVLKPVEEKGLSIRFFAVDFENWVRNIKEACDYEREVHLSDFEITKKLGKGGCAKVYAAKEKQTGDVYAMKVLEKASMEKIFRKQHVIDERQILEMSDSHPFILSLKYAFQTPSNLYMITELCDGGDLYKYLVSLGRPLPERRAKRVAAEIILGLEFLHESNAIYRDLKLENILIDKDGHIRLADFGLSKIIRHPTGNKKFTGAKSFCGTREYVAPELIASKEYGQAVDLWSLAVVLYEMVSGRTPFNGKNEEEMFARIQEGSVSMPRGFSPQLTHLLKSLFVTNPKKRLGTGSDGLKQLKSHPWFKGVNWDSILRKDFHTDNIAVNPATIKYDNKIDAEIAFQDTELGAKRGFLSRFGGSRMAGKTVAGYSFCSKKSHSLSASVTSDATGIFQEEDYDLDMPRSATGSSIASGTASRGRLNSSVNSSVNPWK